MIEQLLSFRSQLFGLRDGARVPIVTPEEVAKRLKGPEAPVLIDVRTPHEYAHDGHIPGARLLPLSSLMKRLDEIPRDREVVCVCRSGNRSNGACELLMEHGYENVFNLEGGMIRWRRAGLETC